MTADPFALLLPAAGKSTRYGGPRSKLLEMLRGQTVIGRAVAPFLARADLAEVIVATDDPDSYRAILTDARVRFVPGGATRADSVRSALGDVSKDLQWVAVHDAARPLVSAELIETTLAAARRHGAAVPAMAVHLTIKQATGPLPARVEKTIPRQALWAMQTPQVARRTDLLDAFERCPIPLDQVTDDVQLLELIDKPVWLVPGQERNLKVTTAVDKHLAEWWLGQGGLSGT
jgi:2-C-methyl-D-erythritol 4-phosphate cytidylyltransferase